MKARKTPGRRPSDTEQVCFRLPASWVTRLEALAATDGRNRTELLREAIAIGLRELDRRLA